MAKRYFGVSRKDESKELGRRIDKVTPKKDKQILLSEVDNNDYNDFLLEQRNKEADEDRIVQQLENEKLHADLVKQNQTQEKWYSGITNFFQAGEDRSDLAKLWYDKSNGKWYRMNNSLSMGYSNDKVEIPKSEVEKIMEKQARGIVGSGGYQAGIAAGNVAGKAFEDGAWGTVYSLGSLIARGVTGNWDNASSNQMKSLGNTVETWMNNIQLAATEQAKDWFGEEGKENFLWGEFQEKKLRDTRNEANRLENERRQINAEGQKALNERYELEKKRQADGSRTVLDKLYDWSGVGKDNEWLEQQRQLKQTISARAMEIENRKKKSFSNAEDTTFNPQMVKFNGQDIPTEIPGQDGNRSIWDVKKLVIDASGNPVKNPDGTPQYADKYSFADKVMGSNWNVLGDAYYLQDDIAEGVGTAIGFVAGGKGINVAVEGAAKGLGTATSIAARSLGLETKAFNYANKVLGMADDVARPLGKTVNQVDRVAFGKAVNTVNDKISKAIRTGVQSYVMTNTESDQIGRQVQKDVLQQQIDKHAGIDVNAIAQDLVSKSGDRSSAYVFMEAQNIADQQRQQWANDNPGMFNEILLQSQLAQQTARELNNINVINNLTSAGLFLKGNSFARNLLTNPFSKASIAKGAWTVGREMFQEGVIEEGLINMFAEKAGKSVGNLKYYDTSEFFKNDVGTAEFAENVFLGAILGGLQTAGTHAVNANTMYNQFREQKKIINELSQIGALRTKEDIKRVIEYSLDKANNEAVAERINNLVKDGKQEEAKALADTLLLNKAVRAASTGTTDVLNQQFTALLNSEELTADDKLALQKAIDFNNYIADTYDAHIQYNNKSSIIENRGNKAMLENYKNEIMESLPGLENNYNVTVDRVARQMLAGETSDYTNENYNDILENRKASLNLNEDEHRTAFEFNQAKRDLKAIQDIQDTLDDKYEHMISLKGQTEYMNMFNAIRRQNIINSVTEENAEQVREQLQETDDLTPEVNSQINQTVEQRTVENNTEPTADAIPPVSSVELTNPDTVEISNSDTQEIPDTAKQNAGSQFTQIAESNLFEDNVAEPVINESEPDFSDPDFSPTREANDNDALLLQPATLDETNPKHRQLVKKYQDVIQELNTNMNDQLQRDIKPNEAFGLFVNSVDAHVAEQQFNFFKQAFDNAKIPMQDQNWDSIYDKYFSAIKKFTFQTDDLVEVPTTPQEATRQDTETNSIIQEDSTPIGFTQNNSPIKYLGRKLAVAMNKIPFLGVKYRAVIDEINGTVTYVDDAEGELNSEGSTNLNVILNPDILVPGKLFSLEIPLDWKTRTVSEWNRNQAGFLVQNSITMEEWMNKNGIEEGSKEWADKVPMDMILDGVNIGSGVHDVAWWNTRNIADFADATINGEKLSPEQAIQRQREVITQGREMTSAIRQAVLEGNNEMVITEREEGHTLTNADGKLTSLYNANPETQLSIFSPQGFITNKGDNGNEYFKGIVVNADSITDKGHIFMISRLGTRNINGENVPTYVAHKVITNNDQDKLRELARSRQRLYDASDILNKQGQFQNPTREQIVWAERVRDQVKSMTGISINTVSMDNGNVQYTGLARLKQLYPLPVRNGDGMMLLPQLANLNNQKLPIVHEDGSVTNYQSEAGVGYKAMLMDNLYTQKKFHKIEDGNNNTIHVLDVQPKIQFEATNKVVTPVQQEILDNIQNNNINPPVTEDVVELTEEERAEPIVDITVGQQRRVVQYLVNNILSSVDIAENFTVRTISDAIKNSYDNYLSNLAGGEFNREYEYLVENRDSILGLGQFSNDINTVRSEIESFLSQTIEVANDIDPETGINTDTEMQLDDEGIFEKNNNKASFENDVRTSLSTKLKMFFSGIEKTNSVITEQFAGLPEYYTTDEVIGSLQDMLVNVSNDPKSFTNKVQNQIERNPEEFGFLQQILDKFNSAEMEIQKEILFRLNQTKNEMFFVMYSKTKGGNYTLMTYDANSKNPNIKTKLEWQENLKQSDLLVNFGDTYRVRDSKANDLLKQFDSWKNRYNTVSNQEYIDWLTNFGIQVSNKTIQDFKDGNIEGHTNFPGNFTLNGGLFGTLANNLKMAVERQKSSPDMLFKYRKETKDDKDAFNILTNNNNGFLKTIIDVQVNNTFNLASSMYIGGKTINAFSQPNYTTEQLRKLKDINNELVNNLKNSAFSKNSFLLRLMDNAKIKNALNIGYVSLQSLKQQGQKSYQDSEIVDLSSQDYDLLLQGFFQNEASYFKNQELEDRGIKIREIKMTFPTLSDSSQMFVFNTVGLDLNKGNFTFDELGEARLGKEVLDVLYSQLVQPDLERIAAYLKSSQNLNVQGHNLGSQIFTMIPSMNTMAIDLNGNKVKFLTLVHQEIKNGKPINEIFEQYQDQIYNKIEETLKDNVDSKFKIRENVVTGSWVDNGFVDGNFDVSFMDSKYINSRGTTNKAEQLQIAAYDYVTNYYLNQAQIQMLFAGDIANYVQDKQEAKFQQDRYGKIDVTKPIVSTELEGDQLANEQQVYTNIIKATSVNMSKRLKELISPGNRIAESNGEKYMQIMVNDIEESSTTLEQIVKTWYPELYNENKESIQKLKRLEVTMRRGIKNGEPVKATEKEYKDLSKALQKKFPDIKDYFNITATDAQEYTTWQEHLHILLNQGRIGREMYSSLLTKLSSQSTDGLNDSNKLTKEEKKIVLQPIKPLHAGMYFEDMTDQDGNVISKSQRFVYVKTSSFPLLPELTQGLEIDNLRRNAENLEAKLNKKVRISYQSGNKVGAVKNAISMAELYGQYSPELENKIIESSAVLDRDNFSIQQDKPFKTDKNIKNNKRDEVNRGTQFEKIILGNGINKITEKIFPNKFDASLLEEFGIENTDNISGEDLYKIYAGLYANEQKILRNQLYNSLGLDINGEWNNNIESLEHIQSVLNQRLSNQQDKEILELSYIVPTLENGKYVNKYYTKQEIQEQGLKPTSAEFNIPIWMSPNSRKFESVLNSVVNNKLVNLKFPGFSSPVASQEGFTYMEETDLKDKTGIIFTEQYNPETGLTATHNSDGSLKYAQVLVASKFRTKVNGKDTLIDMSEYTTQLENGRTVLDMNRITPDLLQLFSFRIPTSAHQSGALIEIVGLLPHNSGDLMIVPKDHTTQIGEDYDIDTRYVYSQNYRVTSNGDIRKIDADYINQRINDLDSAFNDKQKWDAQVEDILNIFDEFRNNEEIQSIFEQDRVTRERKHQVVTDALRHLLIENQLVDVYKSVFSSTNDNVQKMIGATLSTKFAEDTADAIDQKLNSAVDSSNFSIFDDRHQKSILRLGASGKLGIGVHSNWVVLNSLLQQLSIQPRLISGYDTQTGSLIPWNMTIGNFTSDGTLGRIHALEPNSKMTGFSPRLLSVVNMESQNSATDNQKLQIMGRRNENKYTINVFALMSNLGFDKDIVNGKELSLPSLFISQPIIRRYVELKEQYDSIMSEYQDDVDNLITEQLIDEFGEGVEFDSSANGYRMTTEQRQVVERTDLTAQRLYDSLIKGNNAQQWLVYEKFLDLSNHARNINKVQQLGNIDSDGLGISFFNTINKKDNLIYNMNSENLNIHGIERLFGEKRVISSDEVEELEPGLLEAGYIKVQEGEIYTYMRPTTPLNAKLISAIGTGYNLWNNVLPFEDEFINEQILDILNISGKEDGTKAGIELKYKIISDMKDFIYSYNNLGIFDNDITTERSRLFIDSENNESLASYLNRLKKNKNVLFNEPFFKELEFVLSKGSEASLIKYTTNDRTNYNKNSVYNTFSVLDGSKNTLPDFNGNPYTWELLAKDLVKYSLLSNQENGAIGFRNYIPMTILNKYQVTENLRKFSGVGQNTSHNLLLNGDFRALLRTAGAYDLNADNTVTIYNRGSLKLIMGLVDRINTKFGPGTAYINEAETEVVVNNVNFDNFRSIFTTQFFQHNPEEAKKMNWRNKKEWIDKYDTPSLSEMQWFTLNKNIEDKPEYLSIRDSKNSTFLLFEKNDNGVYTKINKLGSFGFNEYSPFTYNAKSLIPSNNETVKNLTTVAPVETDYNQDIKGIVSDLKINEGIGAVVNNIANSDSRFREMAQLIAPFVQDIPINVINLQGIANGLYVPLDANSTTLQTSFGTLNRGSIYLSEDLLKSGNKEKINYAIMEEIVHGMTVDEINKYVDTTKTYLNENGDINIEYTQDNIPAHIVKLVALFKDGSKHILNKYAESVPLQEAIEKINQQRAIWNNDTDSEYFTNNVEAIGDNFKSNIYRTLNLSEFIAGVMLSDTFRNEMSNVQYRKTEKSILQNFADVIARILNVLNPNRVSNSITENTLDAVMSLLTYKGENEVSPAKQSVITETMLETDQQAMDLLNDPDLGTEGDTELLLQPEFISDLTDMDKKDGVGRQIVEQMMDIFPNNVMSIDEAMKLEDAGIMDERVYRIAKMLGSQVYVFRNTEAEQKAIKGIPKNLRDVVFNDQVSAFFPRNGVDILLNIPTMAKHRNISKQNVLAHELAHVFTANIFEKKVSELEPYQREFRREVKKAFNMYKNTWKTSMLDYGFTNEMEFVAEYMSSQAFRDHVGKKYNNFFRKVERFIARLLGIETISPEELNQVFNAFINETEVQVNTIVNLQDIEDLPTC